MAGPIVRLLSQLGGILGISQGGTGASSATAARENLGLKIGTNVQAYSATLAGLAAATYANGTILSGDGDGIPGTLTLGAGLTIAGSELVCTVSGGGGWSTDGTKTTTTQLVRIGGIEPSAMSSFRTITASDAQTWDGLASFVSSNLSTTRVIAKARGTAASPAAVQSGDGVGVYPFWAYNGSTFTQVAAIVVTVPGTYTTTPGGRMALQVRAADGSNFTVLTLDPTGPTIVGSVTGDGSTWYGGTSSGGSWRLDSTSSATKGPLQFNGTSAQVTAAGVFSCPGAGTGSERFGVESLADGFVATAIGSYANAGHQHSIAIGRSATTTDNFQCVIAHPAIFVNNIYVNGVTTTTPTSFAINGCGGIGTNVAGANVTIAGGKATGNAAGGSVRLQTSAAGSSGTTLQTLTDNILCEPGQKTTIYGRLKANATFGDWGSPANLATALDASQYSNWWITLTGNYTPTISNVQDGQSIQLTLEQDATGNRTINLSSLGTIRWVDATPTFTTTPNKFSSILLKRKGSTWIGWSLGTEV